MTDLNLEELKKAAQNATQGAWELVDFNEGMCPPRPLWGVANDQFFNPTGNEEDDWLAVEIHTGTKNDAAHIAAFDPPTVLALIARIDNLEATIQRVRDLHAPEDDCANFQHTRTGTMCPDCYLFCASCQQHYPCRTIQTLEGDEA